MAIKFAAGTDVWSEDFGRGTVVEVKRRNGPMPPIIVRFGMNLRYYTPDGRLNDQGAKKTLKLYSEYESKRAKE